MAGGGGGGRPGAGGPRLRGAPGRQRGGGVARPAAVGGRAYGRIATLEQATFRMNALPLYGWFANSFTKMMFGPPPAGEPGYTFSVGVMYPKQETFRENAGDLQLWVQCMSQLPFGESFVQHLPIFRIPASVALSELTQEDLDWAFKMGLTAGGWSSCAWPPGAEAPTGAGSEQYRIPRDVTSPQTHLSYYAPGAGGAITVGDLPRFEDVRRVFGLRFDGRPPPIADWAGPRRARLVAEHMMRDLKEFFSGCVDERGEVEIDMTTFNAASLRRSFRQITGLWPKSPLDLWALGFRIHNVYTQEFVGALATYLKDRLAALGAGAGPIVEVGAGFGVLSQALRSLEVPVVATSLDDAWPIQCNVRLPPCGVQREDQSESVARLKPSIILCAWMPQDEDWTPVWREHPSVREYILIGAPPTYGCPSAGTAATWCMPEDEGDDEVKEPRGWQAHGVPEVSRWCICYADGDHPFSLSTVLSVRRL